MLYADSYAKDEKLLTTFPKNLKYEHGGELRVKIPILFHETTYKLLHFGK
jgi:hypothetical protein